MIVAGLGCKAGATADAVLAAIAAALQTYAVERETLNALASSEKKAIEPGIREAAIILSLPLHVVAEDLLRDAQAGTVTHSSFSMAVAGVSSVSEAAALAACGPGSALFGPRVARNGVTCALAFDGVLP